MNKEWYLEIRKDISTAKEFLALTYGISKSYMLLLIICSIVTSLAPFINIIMPKFIIDELINEKRVDVFITLVLVIILLNFIFNVIKRILDAKIQMKNMEILNGFNTLVGKKIMNMNFEYIEDPEILDLKEKAMYPINTQRVIEQMVVEVMNTLSNFIMLIGLITVVLTLDLYVILIIIFIAILNSSIYKKTQKYNFEFANVLTTLNRTIEYYDDITKNFSMGKDVRIYDISPLIMGKIKESNSQLVGKISKLFRSIWSYKGISKINLQIQIAFVYGYMTYKVFVGSIGIGSFTMYISAANSFSNSFSEFISSFINLRYLCKYLQKYIEFEQIESINREGTKNVENIKEFNIEFKNVSFKYPKREEYTLKNISLLIKNGEKLSVVGENGAGKTTFIKLLTRLYEPTEGEILLNGINIREYKYEEYMKLLSVVFQDFKLMAFTIKENVSLNYYEDTEDKLIYEALKKSGAEKYVLNLPKGINTNVYKIFYDDGIELSGGQAQKLAISRCAYKNAPIVVLDEPTSALDPIAEFEIYSKFNKLIGKKTSIYISHRLSSCKFCDKIAVFHKGELIQHGTHEELMIDEEIQYRKMYEAQAQYYV